MGWRAHEVSMPGMDYALFTADKATVASVMGLHEDAAQMGAQPRWMGYVGRDYGDATAERIRQLGGAVHVPPEDIPGVSRFSVVADPQAAMFALFKGLKPGQRSAGAGGWAARPASGGRPPRAPAVFRSCPPRKPQCSRCSRGSNRANGPPGRA